MKNEQKKVEVMDVEEVIVNDETVEVEKKDWKIKIKEKLNNKVLKDVACFAAGTLVGAGVSYLYNKYGSEEKEVLVELTEESLGE